MLTVGGFQIPACAMKDREVFNRCKLAWNTFMQDVGRNELTALASELSGAAAKAEESMGFQPRGKHYGCKSISSSNTLTNNLQCCGALFRNMKTSTSDLRSSAPLTARLLSSNQDH